MTLERAFEIVKNNKAFIHKHLKIDGCSVDIFSYMLATYNDFKDNDAFELRGLTFVDGKRYWSIPKFFNINEIEGNFEHDLKQKEIVDIRNKEDGSMISFFKVGDRLVAKSKFSVESDQAKAAQSIVDGNSDLKSFIIDLIDNNLYPIFEFVSPTNKIVLNYDIHDLVLLQVRTEYGKFLSYETTKMLADDYNVRCAKSYDFTLEQMLEKADINEGIEGWVVRFSDGHMIKIKTKWYFKMHYLNTEIAYRENKIIECVLDETIDDVLSQFPEKESNRKILLDIQRKVSHYIDNLVFELKQVIEKDGVMEKKEFVEKYKHDDNFHYLAKIHGKSDDEYIKDIVVRDIKKKTFRLESAREFLNSI